MARKPSSDEEAREWALKRYQNIVSNNSELMISGSDDHTLFLWNLFASVSQGGQGGQEGKGEINIIIRSFCKRKS
jgi:ribosome assembly protein 4